ncbi:MAG TPA: hypothetical protein VGH28_19925 [Polyangiaceae bacterium]|jgi:hypothetical protein
MSNGEKIASVVPTGAKLTPAEADAIVEIAYVTIAADRKLDPAEVDAFRAVLERLRAAPVDAAQLDVVLDQMYARVERVGDGLDEHLRALGTTMSPGARELAYKVAYAMGVADLDTSDEEFELDLQLVDALDLTTDRAEALADEVMSVLNPEEDFT